MQKAVDGTMFRGEFIRSCKNMPVLVLRWADFSSIGLGGQNKMYSLLFKLAKIWHKSAKNLYKFLLISFTLLKVKTLRLFVFMKKMKAHLGVLAMTHYDTSPKLKTTRPEIINIMRKTEIGLYFFYKTLIRIINDTFILLENKIK